MPGSPMMNLSITASTGTGRKITLTILRSSTGAQGAPAHTTKLFGATLQRIYRKGDDK